MHLELQKFLTGALEFRARDISGLEIMRIYRCDLPARTIAHSAIRVIFKSTRGREAVVRKSRLLGRYVDPASRQPTAGFRMDVPDYLAPDFRTLEDTGYQLREEYGETLRKYIKYDETALNLYLEVRFPGDKRWSRITPRLAREIIEVGDREMTEGIKKCMRRRSVERGANLSTTQTSRKSTTPQPTSGIAATPSALRLSTGTAAMSSAPRPATGQRPRRDSAMSGVEEGEPASI